MTELLEKAVAAIRQMPVAEQDDIAAAILSMTKLFDDAEAAAVDPDELLEVKEALAEVDRGEIATPEEVAAAWRSFKG